ncbi:MAG: hypothetical protein A2W85_08145 [Bacteroidetes bacterium GWF2_41_31]|nr:MAG: hypothetical protein A2W85_08145 [Bacteroidetes bacterium GWF2_41_31]
MRQTSIIIVSLILFFVGNTIEAQQFSSGNFTGDETTLYAMNKQVGQFIKRFNMEEDQFGKVLSVQDSKYRNGVLRKSVLPNLFDQYNPRTSGTLKNYFIEDVTKKAAPVFLQFLDTNWFAEVSAQFTYQGEPVDLILFLTLEKENLGSKWVLSNAYFNQLNSLFPFADSILQKQYFLHPQSHELDFMNLHKALEDPAHIEYYASQKYQPDYLTLFFYLMKNKQLTFEKIKSVKFHFLQIDHWYFELSYYNRDDMNSGWLISNLIYADEKDKIELLKTFRVCSAN